MLLGFSLALALSTQAGCPPRPNDRFFTPERSAEHQEVLWLESFEPLPEDETHKQRGGDFGVSRAAAPKAPAPAQLARWLKNAWPRPFQVAACHAISTGIPRGPPEVR